MSDTDRSQPGGGRQEGQRSRLTRQSGGRPGGGGCGAEGGEDSADLAAWGPGQVPQPSEPLGPRPEGGHISLGTCISDPRGAGPASGFRGGGWVTQAWPRGSFWQLGGLSPAGGSWVWSSVERGLSEDLPQRKAELSWKEWVSPSGSGCHHRTPQAGWLLQQTVIYLFVERFLLQK